MGPGVTPRNCSLPSGVVVHGSDFRLMMHVTDVATTLTITTIITYYYHYYCYVLRLQQGAS